VAKDEPGHAQAEDVLRRAAELGLQRAGLGPQRLLRRRA
jgi:hypothetical protein